VVTKQQARKELLLNVKNKDPMLLFWCMVYSLAASVYPVIGAVMPKVLIQGLMSENPSITWTLQVVGIFTVMSIIVALIMNLVNGYQGTKVTKLRIEYVKDMSVRLMTMDYEHTEDAAFLEQYDHAFKSVASNNNGVEGVYNTYWELPSLILTSAALAVIMGSKSVVVLIAIVLNVLVSLYGSRRVMKFQYEHKEEKAKAERRLSYYTTTAQDFSYGKDIRLYHLKDRMLSNLKLEMKKYVDIVRMIADQQFHWDLLMMITLLGSDAVIYGTLVIKTLNGMSIADFSMLFLAASLLLSTLKTLADQYAFIENEMLYIEDFFKFMQDELGTEGGTHKAVDPELPLKVEFRNMSFRYPGSENWIFEKLNLVIPAGQKLAVVGINGAGKTTLVKLMTGLFYPTEGSVLINDVDVREYNKKELAKMFAVVFQDVNIMCYTVEENIAGRVDGIDEKQVDLVLEKVGLKEKIDSLPKGKKHPMLKVIEEDGVQLSGGQNQKLAIARALYKGGNMVVMDEPTAALDALAEAEIYEDFAELVQGKTAVYISHRLASTKFCDRIAFFDGNGLSEYGSHEELMEKQGKYYEMFTVQGKYYQSEIEEQGEEAV